MKNHLYIVISVILWGMSQFLTDRLLLVFSPILSILIRFLLSGILLLLLPKQQKRRPFYWKYIITGALGAFGYYFLATYALSLSSIAFTAIMGGTLPILAILIEQLVVKRRPSTSQLSGAVLSLIGIVLFSIEANFKGSLLAAILMILANILWILYGYLKVRWRIGEDSTVLCYEFISAAFLCMFLYPAFHILSPITWNTILELVAVVIFATILPYWFYQKGSARLSLSIASMYMNLLPITALLPIFVLDSLRLNGIQLVGIGALILSAFLGNI